MKKICIDFDGVIHDNLNYKGTRVINGNLIPGTKEALKKLSEHHTVIIHSARCEDDEAMQNIAKWLKKHELNYAVVKNKPNAHIFIDDRAICFNGKWDETLEKVSLFSQWQTAKKRFLKYGRKLKNSVGVSN